MIILSNSSLASYIDRGSGNYNNRTDLISGIVIHSAATVGTCSDLSNIIKTTPAGSFNYGIATDGTVGLYVDEMYRAWSTGNPSIDHKTVSIVVCNSSTSADQPISTEAFSMLIKLCTDICRRNYIKRLTFTGKAQGSNLYMHSWFANVNCPGRYLSSMFPSIVTHVNANLSKPQLANSTSEAYRSQTNIVVDAINPYVACIDPTAKNVDYARLISAGVVGVMFYCGTLYADTVLKIQYKNYVSSTLKSQIEALSDALPYALYCDVKAWNKKSAKEECEALYYVVSKYPPKLGLWLRLDLGLFKATNNKIIDTYYEYITKWGLKDKCGLYCTKAQLSKIDWDDKYCKKFSLWLIDTVPGISNLNELLVPNFFKF